MRILNFGSLNYDYVYSMERIIIPGETLASSKMETYCGGKGLNQSVALAKAGADVWHAGMVGEDGAELLKICKSSGINVTYIKAVPGKSGHTVIQVDADGQNCILLYGGSNRCLSRDFIEKVFYDFDQNDIMLIQNEVNDIDYIIEKAYKKGMRIAFNPSPFDDAVKKCDLSKVSYLLLNEIEGGQISGKGKPQEILEFLSNEYPDTAIVLTLGKDGAVYRDKNQTLKQGIYPAEVVDTTAAGDTFTGFFLASVTRGDTMEQALRTASIASSIAVSRKGATPSIPSLEEVMNYKC